MNVPLFRFIVLISPISISLSVPFFISSKTIIPLRFIFDNREMTTSLDRWEKDPFFAAAEEVQESADRFRLSFFSRTLTLSLFVMQCRFLCCLVLRDLDSK